MNRFYSVTNLKYSVKLAFLIFGFQFYCFGKIYTKVGMDGALTKTESVSTNTRFKRIVKNLKLRNVADKRVFKCECHIFVSPVT